MGAKGTTIAISEVGYWSGLAAFASTVGYVVVQLRQIASVLRFPFDEVLSYGASLCIVIPFVLEMLSLHYLTPNDKQFWTHASLIFPIIYAVFVTANLATVVAIPALSRTGFDRWVRMSFIANALVTPLISIVYFYPTYSERLLFLGFPWAITAPLFMLLLAIMLRGRRTSSLAAR